jgi:xylulose-5-phosphate/fructose-6-phosphate phosphoketolase
MATRLDDHLLARMDAYWRASNYLSVGQIYLLDNPLLKQALMREHVKPRLVGHWGTTPGLNFIYVHLNRIIKNQDLDMIYIIGPGHGGPATVAHAYLESTYSEIYPNISQDEEGMKRLFRQFSFPGGIPVTSRLRRPDPSMKGVNLDTHCRTLLEPPSIILT